MQRLNVPRLKTPRLNQNGRRFVEISRTPPPTVMSGPYADADTELLEAWKDVSDDGVRDAIAKAQRVLWLRGLAQSEGEQ